MSGPVKDSRRSLVKSSERSLVNDSGRSQLKALKYQVLGYVSTFVQDCEHCYYLCGG